MSKVYFVDTCFLINLVSEDKLFHQQAMALYQSLCNTPDVVLKISTLAVAEFTVKDDIKKIPSSIKIQPFSKRHAITAGIFGKVCSKSRREVDNRIILLNDSKLFAQAQQEGAVGFVSADVKAQRAFDILKENNVVSFDFHNIAL